MIIRVIASAIIILGCTYVGTYFGVKLSIRVHQLSAFQSALETLKFNILFLNLPLAEALYKVAKSLPASGKPQGCVGRIFKAMSREISRSDSLNGTVSVQNAWELSVAKERKTLNLNEEEIQTLAEFVSRLGSGDRDDQTGNIEITTAKLSTFENDAREYCKKNAKLYRGLGLLAGLLLVVLLI